MSKLPFKYKPSTKLNKFSRFRTVNNVKTENKTVKNDLVIIEGIIESNRTLKILIDTGSQAELISKEAAVELGKEIRPSNFSLAAAQGSDFNVVGECDLTLNIAGHMSNLTTQVVEDLSTKYQVILGVGWMNENKT